MSTTETGFQQAGFQEEVPLLPTSHHQQQDDQASETSTNSSGSMHLNEYGLNPTKKGDDDILGSSPSTKGHYSLFVAVCFSLNYSIGSGILGLPYEYFNAGYILGSALLVYLGILTYITYTFVMDGIQRAEAITTLSKQYNIDRHKLLNDPTNTKDKLQGTSIQLLQSNYSFNKNEYQLSELIGIDI